MPPSIVVFGIRVGLLIIAVLGCVAPGRTDERLEKKVSDAKDRFKKLVEAAKKETLLEFDRTIASLKSAPGLTEAARKDKIDRWSQGKKQFESATKFLPEDEFAPMELKYYLSVDKAFAPVAKVINESIKAANKNGSTELAAEGVNLKARLESELLGVNRLYSHSKWHGTLRRSGETIHYHLHLKEKKDGGSFTGHVEDNPGVAGNWAYDVEGQTQGLGVEFVMTKSIRGRFKAVHVSGIVSGERLIAKVTQAIGDKSNSGFLILHLVK